MKEFLLDKNQTIEDKIKTFQTNVFFTIIDSSKMINYKKKTNDELIKILRENPCVLIPNLPIFEFIDENVKKTLLFSNVPNERGYDEGYYNTLTINEIEKYLNGDYWIFIYTIADEIYDDNLIRFKVVILNKSTIINQ